jgi:N-acyl-D-amino-acid deacylase
MRIAEEAGLPAQISHIKLGTTPVWRKADAALRLIEAARQRGLDITADLYPYLYWQSTITALVTSRDWANRTVWEKGLAEVGGAGHVLLSRYTREPAWTGQTLAQIAGATGKDAVTLIQEIVQHTQGEDAHDTELVVVTAMEESDLQRFMVSPHVMFCSDGGPAYSHPRGAGTYPRILGRYVCERHVLPLEAAIRKMTALPAWRMGFRDRGTIQIGKKADLVLFNPHTVRDTATVTYPYTHPLGLPEVIVNGVPVLEAGRMTGAHPGHVLRHTPVNVPVKGRALLMPLGRGAPLSMGDAGASGRPLAHPAGSV